MTGLIFSLPMKTHDEAYILPLNPVTAVACYLQNRGLFVGLFVYKQD